MQRSSKPAVASGKESPQPQLEATVLKQEALNAARQVAELYPQDALAYALLGSAAYNTGRSEEATKYLQKCLELNPGQVDAYEVLARVAYEKGKLEESVRLCQEALKARPANPEVLARLGRSLLDLGRTQEAIRSLEQAVAVPKPSSESLYLLGLAHLQSGEFQKAKESFLRAIAVLPDHTQAFFGLYTACLRLGQTEEAGRYRAQFQKLEAVDRRTLVDRNAQEDTLSGLPLVRRTVARTLFGAGQIYRVHEQAGKAAELFRRSAVLDADSSVYRAALQALFAQRNTLADAVPIFEQLAAEQPGNPLNYLFLGHVQGRLQQFEAAQGAYRKVQELAPERPEGYRALAEFYLSANRNLEEARTLARKVVDLEPSGPHYYLLAVACVKNNERTRALEAMKQAVALSPGEKKYQQVLQQLEAAPAK